MSAGDLAAVVVSVLALVAAGALVAVLVGVLGTLRRLRVAIDTLHDETLPLVDELSAAVHAATEEIGRVEQLVGTAEAITARVDGASRLATAALSRPVIKTVAVATGTSRAAKRLRKGG